VISNGHTYAENGSYTVTVKVTHNSLPVASNSGSVTVADAAVSVGVPSFSATEAASFTGQVATFTDPGGADGATSEYTATVNYGETGGTDESATVQYVSGTTYAVISNGHTYAEDGSYTVTVKVTHNSLPVASNSGSVTVADPAVTVGVPSFSATEAASFTGQVATFTDPGGADGATGEYTATVNYGETGGTDESATVQYVNGTTYAVISNGHTYAEDGSYTVTVKVTHNSLPVASNTGSVTVADAAVTVGVPSFSPNKAVLFTGQVATFTDPGGADGATGEYTATVNYGETGGTDESATVQYVSGTTYAVISNGHTYAQVGTYNVTVNVTHNSLPVVSNTGSVTVTGLTTTYIQAPSVTAPDAASITVIVVCQFGVVNSGTVSLQLDGNSISPANNSVVNGVASFTISPTTAGNHTLTANYSGSGSPDFFGDSSTNLSWFVFGGTTNMGIIILQNSATMTATAPFTNSGTVEVLDTSSLSVTGPANTYTASSGTTIVDGTLSVNGGAGQVNMSPGSLYGSGTINAAVNVGSGSIVQPGDLGGLPGVLQTGNATLTSGAFFLVYANGNGSPGTNYSQLASNGTVNLGGSTLAVGLVGGYTPAINQTLTIVTATTVTGTFSQGSSINVAGYTFSITYNNLITDVPNSVVLTCTGVPLLAAGGPRTSVGSVPALTTDQLTPIVQEAIALWSAAGASTAQVQLLQGIHVQIVTLGAGLLGDATAGTIYVDATAAGYGWFTDPNATTPAPGTMDLLTVVMHEMGHELGLSDLDPASNPLDVMAATLAAGIRRTPTLADVSAAFSS
jgi:hypothetical protein